MSIIKIKRSSGHAAPTALALGEFGYTYGTGTQANGGDRLYLGTSGESGGVATAIDIVGGKYFTEMINHAHGTLTASSAIIVDSNSKIDLLNIDNLTLNGNTLSSTNTNGAIILDPVGTGVIQLNGPVEFSSTTQLLGLVNANGGIAVDTDKFTVAGDGTGNTLIAGTLGVAGETTLASAIVSDLTNNRIVIAGTAGAIEDDANFTFDGTTFTVGATTITQASGNTLVGGTLETQGLATLNTAVVENLTNNRIVIAGSTSNLEDDSKLTFDGTTFTVTSATQITGVATVTGQLNVDNIRLDANTISTTNTNGNIVLTPNGTGYVTISGTNGLVIPSGTNAQQAPTVTGAIRYNSDNTQFEGYSGTNWSSLGGVRSVDGFTFIVAESSPAASDDILHFYASNAANNAATEVAQLDIVSQRLLQTTTSTSNTTGALVVAGGVGIAENLNVGGDTVLTGDLQVKGGDLTTNQTTFNLINTNATTVNAFGAGTNIGIGTGGIAGGDTNIGHDLTVVGNLDVGGGNFTVAASTGHVETAGNMIIGGDLTVNGTRTTVNVDTLDVEDALIRLANGNTGDAVDIGFIGRYNDGADKLAGIFRDASQNEFYIFDEYVDTNVEDNVIDRSHASFVLADTNVKAIKFATKSFSLTGDVAGTINMSDMGDTNHTMVATIQANSVALGTDTTGNYIATVVQATGGQTDANSTTSNGIVITGSGSETSAVTVGVNIADAAGAIGTSTYNATNFDVSSGGLVTIDTIDGGTF
tara:strand:- start:1209 stop:3482 length:2274 start_codon:yes stop_codon:yes gene_type:complete